MGKPLMEYFGLHGNMASLLSGKVADFVVNGQWNLPQLLSLHFPMVCDAIIRVPLSSDPNEVDKLIWSPSTSGDLSAKIAYQFMRPHHPSLDWSKLIWSKYIAPRMSLLVWKVLCGRVLSEDFLQKRGISLASRCLLCRFDSESLEHIFLLCPFAKSIWSSMVAKFDLPATLPSSLIDMLYFGIVGRSNQLRELWCACYASVI